jgi:hypothetical protein
MELTGFTVFRRNYRPSVLCNVCIKPVANSAMLVPDEKNIGQVHLVYHLHAERQNFGQTGRNDSETESCQTKSGRNIARGNAGGNRGF